MQQNLACAPSHFKLNLTVLLAVGLCTLGSRALADSIDESCLERLKREGPPRWAEAARLMDDIEVECHKTTTSEVLGNEGKAVRRETKFVWKVSWDPSRSRRLVDLYTVNVGVRSRRAINPDYRFQVAQTDKGGQWQVVSCRKAEGAGEFEKYESHEKDYIWAMESGYRLIGINLNEFIVNKEFKITSVRYLPGDEEDRRRVRLEADYLGGKGSYRRPGASYWVELAPGNSWLIVRGGLKLPDKEIEESQDVTYQTTTSGVSFPAMLHYNRTVASEPSSIDETSHFKRPTKTTLSDDEYYLTHYGISESVLETTSTRPMFRIFIFNLGILGLIVALALFLRAKSRRRSGLKPGDSANV